MNRPLPDVSDTARWVAVYRAHESERPDALFHDPFAARLAGDLGHRMAAEMPAQLRRNAWPMVVRTRSIDDLIATSIAEGADRVLNLAAGLDTRPYRLGLPGSLRWIEVDRAAILDDKERALEGATPACRVERERVDLADRAARARLLDRALDGAENALVITEGLLIYLEPEAVRALARDLAARPTVRWSILDIASPGILRMMQRQAGARLGPTAQMRFGPDDGVRFFEPLGWTRRDVRSLFREAARLRRLPAWLRLFAMLPDANPDRPGKRPWSAAVRYERAS